MARLNWDREQRQRAGSQEVFPSISPEVEIDRFELAPAHDEARLRHKEEQGRRRKRTRRRKQKPSKKKSDQAEPLKKGVKSRAATGSSSRQQERQQPARGEQTRSAGKGTPGGSSSKKSQDPKGESKKVRPSAVGGRAVATDSTQPAPLTEVPARVLAAGMVIALPRGAGLARVVSARRRTASADAKVVLQLEPVDDNHSISEEASLEIQALEPVVLISQPKGRRRT